TSPMWGALCGALLLRERMRRRRVVGLAVGIAGVALVTSPAGGATFHYPAVAAALTAAFSYGLIATYIRRWASNVPSRGMAGGSQIPAGIPANSPHPLFTA